eukprot:3195416-Amphidinium_carterae.3
MTGRTSVGLPTIGAHGETLGMVLGHSSSDADTRPGEDGHDAERASYCLPALALMYMCGAQHALAMPAEDSAL